MRRFGSDRVKKILEAFKLSEEDSVIQSKMLTKQVESAQKRVEGNNYDQRKHVLQYDDVMREQREVMYGQRFAVITAESDLKEMLMGMVRRTIRRIVESHTLLENVEEWDFAGIVDFAGQAIVREGAITVEEIAPLADEVKALSKKAKDADREKARDAIKAYLLERAEEVYTSKEEVIASPEQMLEFQKIVILRVVDNKWTDHIDAMEQLRQSITLRSYGQTNPLVAYQTEGYEMFEGVVGSIEYEVTRLFMKAELRGQAERVQTAVGTAHQEGVTDANGVVNGDAGASGEAAKPKPIRVEDKPGRNDPCPCGSGKKYKNCHGLED
jgi:preprotein translocase subunit SecA